MSETIPAPAFKSAGSFASLLESFTGNSKKADEAWDDTALLDDVATVSYEQALRSHRRVTPPAASHYDEHQAAPVLSSAQAGPAALLKNRKSASITIRMTESEEAQLHERAAAAQLSVSAYLRSCIFEAETLRAQVKLALSQIRASAQPDAPGPSQPAPSWSWRRRLLPHWHSRSSA